MRVRSILGILEYNAPTAPYQTEHDRLFIQMLLYYCAPSIRRNLAAQTFLNIFDVYCIFQTCFELSQFCPNYARSFNLEYIGI